MTVSIEIGTFISLKVTNVKISDLVEQSWNEAASTARNYVQREVCIYIFVFGHSIKFGLNFPARMLRSYGIERICQEFGSN